MNAIDKKVLLEKRKKQFGDLIEDILLNIDDSGLVYYTINKDGKKVYGISKDSQVYSEHYFGQSQTQQQFREECDINLVLKRYGAHHDYVPDQVNHALEHFRDLSIAPQDLTEAYQVIDQAHEAFMDLPADLRRIVNDSPSVLLELSSSDEGLAKLANAGFGSSKKPLSDIESATIELRNLISTLKASQASPIDRVDSES